MEPAASRPVGQAEYWWRSSLFTVEKHNRQDLSQVTKVNINSGKTRASIYPQCAVQRRSLHLCDLLPKHVVQV